MNVDVLVVGGGMVGAACALGFAKQGKTVAMVEAIEPAAYTAEQPMDLRISAISHGSTLLLEKLGIWQQVLAMRACPYSKLATWENESNKLQFDASSLGVSELGFMVENRLLQLALWQALKTYQNATLHYPNTLHAIEQGAALSTATLDNGEQISAKLVIAADGAHSWLRTQVGIGITAWDYRHHCLLIHVKPKIPEEGVTWQYFSSQGPVAYLPFIQGDACLVWYAESSRIQELTAMNNTALKREILLHFPSRLGEVEVVNFSSFPLTRRHAQSYYKNNIVLVGDAAHTINPLAGQGVNLGFKDVAAMLQLFEQADSLANTQMLLARYQQKRHSDNLVMQTAMDVFYKGFSNDFAPIKLLRNFALEAIERSGPVKTQILKYAIGL